MASKLQQPKQLDIVQLSPAIGAEARGIDLRNKLDDASKEALRTAWAENYVLLIRGQVLSEEHQVAYARVFGELADREMPPAEKLAYRAHPINRMQLFTNQFDDQGRPLGYLGDGEMWFHTDKCYVEKPHRASFLYAVEIPTEGGQIGEIQHIYRLL